MIPALGLSAIDAGERHVDLDDLVALAAVFGESQGNCSSHQADTREECVKGLAQLVQLDLVPVMLPSQVRTDGWMARAVPRPAPQPEEEQDSGHPTAR